MPARGPARLRRLAGAAVRAGWETACRAGTVRAGDRRAARFYAFGAGSALCFPTAALVGEDRTSIGCDTVIGPYSSLSAGLPGQPPNPAWAGPTLAIGDRCVIGRGVTILAHRSVQIADDVWTGNDVFICDQNHGWADPDLPIGAQAQEPRPVAVEQGAWLGHGCIVLPGVRIGARAVVAAGAVVTTDVPAGAVVGGVPARALVARPGDQAEPGDDVLRLPRRDVSA